MFYEDKVWPVYFCHDETFKMFLALIQIQAWFKWVFMTVAWSLPDA
jgi:hypothetical protein